MPERWERELQRIREVVFSEPAVRERVERGPSEDRLPPRRDRIVAGVVAAVVAIGAIAFVVRTLPDDPAGVGSRDLPVLTASFHDSEIVAEASDASHRRVETTIVYGDAVDESHTSTVPEDAVVDWVSADDLTVFTPGPSAGSLLRFEADGDDPRVLLGRPDDWPNFARMERIVRLPDEPGEYLLVFEADYPEGVARTARRVRIVAPGTLQLMATAGGGLETATAAAYVDGRKTDGVLSTSWFMEGDFGAQSDPRAPVFDGAVVRVPPGSPVTFASQATEARAGFFESFDAYDAGEQLPIDLVADDATDARDRKLLALDVTWRVGRTGLRQDGTEERGVFFFQVEVVPEPEAVLSPTLEPSPTTPPVTPGSVVIDIRRSSPETREPEAIARFGTQEQWMCPDGWTVVNPDGSEESILFDCGQDDVFQAPPGTPITVTGDFETVNMAAGWREPGSVGPTTDQVADAEPGTVVTYSYELTWADGSEASFWLLVTVGGDRELEPDAEPGIVVDVHGLGERSFEQPTGILAFDGRTWTACTQSWEWAIAENRTTGAEAFCSGPVIHVPPGTPIAIEAGTATRVTTTRTMAPFFGGDAGLVVTARWPEGNATFVVHLFVTAATPDVALVELGCPQDQQVDFPPPSGGIILPGDSLFITGNIPGFERDDVVEQMTRKPVGETEWSGIWQVVRDGDVIATVDWDRLSGTACRGSGIGGV